MVAMKNNIKLVAKVARQFLILVAALGLFESVAHADKYVLVDLKKKYVGTAGFKSDPKVCQLYLDNLNYFVARKASLQCGRSIAPHLKKNIQELEWADIEPTDYPELSNQVVALKADGVRSAFVNACNIIEYLSASPANEYTLHSSALFQRSKFSWKGLVSGSDGDGKQCEHSGKFFFVRYTNNGTENPIWPCEKLSTENDWIGNNDPSLFVVGADMNVVRELDSPAREEANIYEGQNLLLIDKKLYWEIGFDGLVFLNQVSLEDGYKLNQVCKYRMLKSKRNTRKASK